MNDQFQEMIADIKTHAARAKTADTSGSMERWEIGRALNHFYGISAGSGYGPGSIPKTEQEMISQQLGKSVTAWRPYRAFHKKYPDRKDALEFAQECETWSVLVCALPTGCGYDGKEKVQKSAKDQEKIRYEGRRSIHNYGYILLQWEDELASAGAKEPEESLKAILPSVDIVQYWKAVGRP